MWLVEHNRTDVRAQEFRIHGGSMARIRHLHHHHMACMHCGLLLQQSYAVS